MSNPNIAFIMEARAGMYSRPDHEVAAIHLEEDYGEGKKNSNETCIKE